MKIGSREQNVLYTTEQYQQLEELSLLVIGCHIQFWKVAGLTFWHRNYFLNFSTPVYKMWIKQEPNTLELGNKLQFEEKKTESIYHV